ncbi:MAG: tRNA uridine-5-carboxymethylaminomethyl(34) synthesis GTPase MnmE [Clostridia bacterium]|nr:tRNA uridine-5-carboxymethylaminomethyl(34) synthesis GTPase MnmE [Clostridia bacterium]
MNSSPIAAIATPNAAGGIGIVRISGKGALELASRVFTPVGSKTPDKMNGYTAAFGKVHDSNGDIDEAVCLVFRAPKSYTGEDVAELSCHGGLFVMQKVLRAVLEAGAAPAPAGEFTKRAFLNGRISLDEAEAVMGIISAQGEQAAKAALGALEGSVSREIDEVCASLTASSAQLAAWVDYPYDEIEELAPEKLSATLISAREKLAGLIKRFDSGKAIMQGVNTVIAGKPNTGKSTLMNLLSGYERSIVTDIAGTTRDVVEQTVRVGDVVLKLSDTAGIHETDDTVESIGVKLAMKQLQQAELVLAVLDGSEPLSDEDRELLIQCKNSKTLVIINKDDLGCKIDEDEISDLCSTHISISAKTGAGRQKLEQAICSLLGTGDFDPSQATLTTERQRACVQKAVICIDEANDALISGMTLDAVTVSVEDAIGALLELCGKTASENVVNEVFARFCVGK